MDEVDYTLTVGTGDGDRGDDGAELVSQRVESLGVVGVILLALGDVEHNGHTRRLAGVPCALCADGQRLCGLLCGDNNDCTLSRAESAVKLTREVKETGAVEDVDLGAFVLYGGNGHGDGDLAALFLCVVVAYGVSVSDLAETVDCAGHEKHALCKAGLAGIAVADKADVADVACLVVHLLLPLCWLYMNN